MRRWLLASMLIVAVLPGLSAASTITVTAEPLWTDTGITIRAGETWRITANGADRWSWGDDTSTDAAGQEPWDYPNTWDRFLYAANHGEMIGFVGADPTGGITNTSWGVPAYYDESGGHQLPGYLLVGRASLQPGGFKWASGTTGRLWLGFNDDAVSGCIGDNSGAIRVSVGQPVPEPTTLLLVGGGLVAIGGLRRRLRAKR
jgi:hypothetical protein